MAMIEDKRPNQALRAQADKVAHTVQLFAQADTQAHALTTIADLAVQAGELAKLVLTYIPMGEDVRDPIDGQG